MMLTTTTAPTATLATVAPFAPSGAEALGAFLANKRSMETRRAYRADLTAFARFLGAADGEADLARALLGASVAAVIAWRDSMASCAPATVARRLAALRTFYKFARSVGAVERNPAELVEAPRVEAARQKAPHLEAGEARALLDAPDGSTVRGLRDRAILGLLAGSGLRRAEAVGLRAGDVRREAAGLSLTVNGKGGRVRTVDIERATAEALLAYLDADGRPLDQADGAAPLFRPTRNPRGGGDCSHALTVRAVNALVANYGERAELRATPHGLRRTFATVALDRGASMEALRRSMGHASPTTTARYDRRRSGTVTVAY